MCRGRLNVFKHNIYDKMEERTINKKYKLPEHYCNNALLSPQYSARRRRPPEFLCSTITHTLLNVVSFQSEELINFLVFILTYKIIPLAMTEADVSENIYL